MSRIPRPVPRPRGARFLVGPDFSSEQSRSPLPAPRPRAGGFLIGPDSSQSTSPARSSASRPQALARQAAANAFEQSRSPLPAPRARAAGFLIGPDSSQASSPAVADDDDDYEERAEAALCRERLRRETERRASVQLGRMDLPSASPSPVRQPGDDGPVIVDGRTPEQREQQPLPLVRLEDRRPRIGSPGPSN